MARNTLLMVFYSMFFKITPGFKKQWWEKTCWKIDNTPTFQGGIPSISWHTWLLIKGYHTLHKCCPQQNSAGHWGSYAIMISISPVANFCRGWKKRRAKGHNVGVEGGFWFWSLWETIILTYSACNSMLIYLKVSPNELHKTRADKPQHMC